MFPGLHDSGFKAIANSHGATGRLVVAEGFRLIAARSPEQGGSSSDKGLITSDKQRLLTAPQLTT